MAANFKFLRFISYKNMKAISKSKEAIKYIEAPRKHHRNVPELFNEAQNHVKRTDFYKEIEEQPQYGVCIHKWKISLSEQERDELKIDMREWTRDFMARVEKEYGKRLSWCAAVHDDERHPHVHIIIRGYGKRVGFYKRDRNKLEKIADEEKRLQAFRISDQKKPKRQWSAWTRLRKRFKRKRNDWGYREMRALKSINMIDL
jgi:hypothetical protein